MEKDSTRQNLANSKKKLIVQAWPTIKTENSALKII